jgi:hypothetical protein
LTASSAVAGATAITAAAVAAVAQNTVVMCKVMGSSRYFIILRDRTLFGSLFPDGRSSSRTGDRRPERSGFNAEWAKEIIPAGAANAPIRA